MVDVRKGSFTCTLIPPTSLADLTLAAGPGTAGRVSRAAAEAYAVKMSAVCEDVLATR